MPIEQVCFTDYPSTILLAPIALCCEYLQQPLGIDIPRPRLSWQLRAAARGVGQAAYQVLVASSREQLANGIGDRWDSGIVASDDSVHIEYQGSPLGSRARCWWAVRTWDVQGKVTPWSEAATFEMGLLEFGDWSAEWIGAEEAVSAPLLRKDFPLTQPIVQARAYIYGLGYYELRLNGCKVGDHVLDPNWTNYDQRVISDMLYPFDDQSTQRALYVSYDVTAMLQTGDNAVGVMLGNGWHNQRERTIEGKMWYGAPRLLLQLEVEYADGARAVVVSDGSWQCAGSPITFNNIFIGEVYDARREQPGWDAPGFAAAGWQAVCAAPRPIGALRAQMSPPDRVMGTLPPLTRSEPQAGVYIFDFGQNFSGWVRLRVQGEAGTAVTLRFAEELFPDGTLDVTSTGGQGSNDEQVQRDEYILNGAGEERYEPRFVWHTFRYVEVRGYPGEPALSALEGCIVHSALASAGDFSCSNPLLNRVQQAYRWTQLVNYHGCVPSDCPHRERLGYTGDGQLTAETAMLNFQAHGLYHKWLNDISDAQNHLTGFVPHTAPFYGGGGGPAWGSAYPIVAWMLYQYYADRRVLAEHYAGIKHWVDYLATCTDAHGIVTHEEPGSWCLGDWSLPGEPPLGDDADPPQPLANTAYYGFNARLLAAIAGVLGKEKDMQAYTKLAETISKNFHCAFFNAEHGYYGRGQHGADAFALALDAVPAEELPRVLAHLHQQIAENDGHLDTGILGTPLLLEMLVQHGGGDIAYAMLAKTTYPGFGFMLASGATTLWENWASENGSHCHPMYGSVSGWFYRILAGIQAAPDGAGFKHFHLRPHLLGDLTSASATVETVRGAVRIHWQRIAETFTLQAHVPAGSTAQVYLPASDAITVRETDHLLWDGAGYHPGIDGVVHAYREGAHLVVEVGGGEYLFECTGEMTPLRGNTNIVQ